MRKKMPYLYISCDLLNENRLWVSRDVYELIKNNPDGVIFETRGERPIWVNWYDPIVHPERYLDDAMTIVDGMTMTQRKELLKYLKDSIEKKKEKEHEIS